MVSSHWFRDDILLVSVLCKPVSSTGKVCMINNRVYVELLFDSVAFLKKRGCSHGQLIIESRWRMN